MRVVEPHRFDWKELVDGIARNNIGVDAIELKVTATVKDGRATLQPTGQTFPIEGSPDSGERRLHVEVLDWLDPTRTRLKVIPKGN